MERYICIHGHFYQPTRLNPWLEAVELQEEAFPHHDWNEKIDAECYTANANAHILNSDKKIIDILNNYSKISFNFGSTLLSWLKSNNIRTYSAIIEADHISKDYFSGHGSAIAQIYNHIIMPLASKLDKYIQIKWSVKDFEANFNRKPEGIWLSETAVDIETLEMLAEMNIKYTILSPNQASMIRKISSKKNLQNPDSIRESESEKKDNWQSIEKTGINTRMPYLCNLPSGKTINIFFYDKELSNELAFGNLLKSGENFAKSILHASKTEQDIPEIITITSDGESFGHHHQFGEMALAYFLKFIKRDKHVKLTVFGEYLEKFPPVYEVKIIENTSWSCPHGVERWKANCGCNSGAPYHSDWNQKWRVALREAIEFLNTKVFEIFTDGVRKYLKPEFKDNPFAPLEEYIAVINNRTGDTAGKFIEKFFKICNSNDKNQKLKNTEAEVLKLLEMYRHSMLAQSSDGWFFDDISRIEAIQVLKHAARAIETAEKISSENLEEEFFSILKRAESNISEFKNGAYIYESIVKKSIYNSEKICANLAFEILLLEGSSKPLRAKKIFPEITNKTARQKNIFSFSLKNIIYKIIESENIKMVIGTADIFSGITYEKDFLIFIAYQLFNFPEKTSSKEYGIHLKPELNEIDKSINTMDIIGITAGNTATLIKKQKDAKKDEVKFIIKKISRFIKSCKIKELLKFLKVNFSNSVYSIGDLARDSQIEIIDKVILKQAKKIKPVLSALYNFLSMIFNTISNKVNLDIKQNYMNIYLPEYLNYLYDGNFINICSFLSELILYANLKDLDIKKGQTEKPDKFLKKIATSAEMLPLNIKEFMKYKMAEKDNNTTFSESNLPAFLPVHLNTESFNLISTKKLDQLVFKYEKQPENLVLLKNIAEFLVLLKKIKITPNLWNAQNIFFNIKKKFYDEIRQKNTADSNLWLKYFNEVLEYLDIEI